MNDLAPTEPAPTEPAEYTDRELLELVLEHVRWQTEVMKQITAQINMIAPVVEQVAAGGIGGLLRGLK